MLGISARTGIYAFTALFLVLFPLWLLYLSNYMAVVLLVAEVAVGIWWLMVEYEHVKDGLGARGHGSGSAGGRETV